MLLPIPNVKIPTYISACAQPLWHRTKRKRIKCTISTHAFSPQRLQHSANVCQSYYKRHLFDVTLRRISFSKQLAGNYFVCCFIYSLAFWGFFGCFFFLVNNYCLKSVKLNFGLLSCFIKFQRNCLKIISRTSQQGKPVLNYCRTIS